MTRAISAFAHHAFHQLGLHRRYATPFIPNVASQRVLEKAGFKRKGVLEHHHLKNGIYLDAVIYERFSENRPNA
jgi:ribosomal-protein-alanine N-acetyltransferase